MEGGERIIFKLVSVRGRQIGVGLLLFSVKEAGKRHKALGIGSGAKQPQQGRLWTMKHDSLDFPGEVLSHK